MTDSVSTINGKKQIGTYNKETRTYSIGGAMQELIDSVQGLHDRFGFSEVDGDLVDVLRRRLPLMVEELGEFAKALNHGNTDAACEEVVDMAFIVLGYLITIEAYGRSRVAQVIAKNDAKRPETHSVKGDKPVARN